MLKNARLLRPINFLKIESEGILWYTVYWPIIWTFLVFIYIGYYPEKINFFGDNSLTSLVLEFIKLLPGFYIASLAAISTFKNIKLDEELDRSPAILRVSENGVIKNRNLTRRRFLSYLFGYLAFISFVLFIYCSILEVANPINFECIKNYKEYTQYIFLFIEIFILVQMLILTFFGLFYLSDRIHWNKSDK